MKRLCLKVKLQYTKRELSSIWKSTSFSTTLEKRMSLLLWLCRLQWKVQIVSISMILLLSLKKSKEAHKKSSEKWKKTSKKRFSLLKITWLWSINFKRLTIKLFLRITWMISRILLKVKSPLLIKRWNKFWEA